MSVPTDKAIQAAVNGCQASPSRAIEAVEAAYPIIRADVIAEFVASTRAGGLGALPFEQRKALAPLLEDYRRLGIAEALGDLAKVRHKWQQRVRDIESGRSMPR